MSSELFLAASGGCLTTFGSWNIVFTLCMRHLNQFKAFHLAEFNLNFYLAWTRSHITHVVQQIFVTYVWKLLVRRCGNGGVSLTAKRAARNIRWKFVECKVSKFFMGLPSDSSIMLLMKVCVITCESFDWKESSSRNSCWLLSNSRLLCFNSSSLMIVNFMWI